MTINPSSQSPHGPQAQWLGNPFVWGLVGFLAALLFCEFNWVRPLRAQLDAREKSLQEWERINRQERQAITTIKSLAVDEVRKWVSTIDEQNQRFAQLQRQLHQQEIELTGPATSYIIIAAMINVAVIGLVVFLLRDANSAAATTLENVAALAPEEMMRSILVASLANRRPVTLLVTEEAAGKTPPATSMLPPPQDGDDRIG